MPIKISNEEIANLVKKGESVSFEYKGTLSKDIKDRLSSYFAAFANTEGGLFVIGINILKETVGYTLEEKERNLISEQAKNCRPQVHIDIEERDYDEQKIVLIHVPKSDNKIHVDSKIRFPIRVGSNMDYLDITGLIPLAREKLGLDYKMKETENLSPWGEPLFRELVKTKAKPEEIDLCLKAIEGTNKDVRLQGLRELEILVYRKEMLNELRILDALQELLNDKEAEIRKKAIEIVSILFRSEDNDNSRQLIERYGMHILNIAETDFNLDVRSVAIRTLVEFDDDHVIKIIIETTINGSDEVFNKIKSYSSLNTLGDKSKLEIKNKLIEELNNSEHTDNIKKRMIGLLEDTR